MHRSDRETPMTTAADLVTAARAKITEVDVDELANRLGEGPIIIDVREPAEFEAGHVFGAVNIPRGVLEFEVASNPYVAERAAPELQLKEAPIFLYCRSGGRSALAAEQLQRLGFTNVRSLAGGFLAWEAADKPTQRP
jgi:rhodanese-related sulfurtransferase